METVRKAISGRVAEVVLTRPEVRNALNSQMIEELARVFDQTRTDERVRAVVIRGEGKAFCAGADLNWMRASVELSERENRDDARRLANLLEMINAFPKPVIAQVHGAAVGGGVGLVGACDVVVAQEGTVFTFSEVRLGLVPAMITPFVLPKIGEGCARRFFLTGERFDAQQAKAIGLVHEVVEAARLHETVRELAEKIALAGPRALQKTKELLRIVTGLPREQMLETCVATIASARASDEGQEGVRAFLEKRKPAWQEPASP